MADRGEADAARGARRATVLVVDGHDSLHQLAAAQLAALRLVHAYSCWQALDLLRRMPIDVVVLAAELPDGSGLGLLEPMRAGQLLEAIVVCPELPLGRAVEAGRRGAFDVLATAGGPPKLGEHIERALEHRRWRRAHIDALAGGDWLHDAFALLEKSWSPALQAVLRRAREVAATAAPVLIEGEPGVGKEVLARYLHALSDRAAEPLVTIDLAAAPPRLVDSRLFGHEEGTLPGGAREGAFELADGGTLFLDAIADLPPAAQAELLRVLDERSIHRLGARERTPVNVRVVATSSVELAREVEAGRFRDDLYRRLAPARLQVPPLRERKPDFTGLVKLLVSKHAELFAREPPTLGADAIKVLKDCPWPGNLRQLEELVMRLVALHPGRTVVANDIPPEYCLPALAQVATRRATPAHERGFYFSAREQFERYLVRLMVDRNGGDVRAAARALGIGLTTAKDKLRGDRADWLDEL